MTRLAVKRRAPPPTASCRRHAFGVMLAASAAGRIRGLGQLRWPQVSKAGA
jgi:hypothetical protein